MRKSLSNTNPDEKNNQTSSLIYKTTNYTVNKNVYNYTIHLKFLKIFVRLYIYKYITLCIEVINILCKYLKYLRFSRDYPNMFINEYIIIKLKKN